MATKRQRRRREKERRHDYEFVYVDQEGQEVEVDDPEPKPRTEKKPAAGSKTAATASKSSRVDREPSAPTWERTFRRAAIFAPFILIFVYLTKSSGDSMAVVLLRSLPLIVLIVPFMYLVDSMAYRGYQKRKARKSAGKSAGSRPKSK